MRINNQKLYIDDDKFVYKIVRITELGSENLCLSYELELVAGWDYIDDSDLQGFVSPDRFVDDVQTIWLTVYPLNETLGDQMEFEGLKLYTDEIQIELFAVNF